VENLVASDWGKALPFAAGEVPRLESRVASEKSQTTNRQPEILETLERWGVRNLRALAALPEVALAERLGQAGLYLQKLARGEMQRALVIAEPPLVFEEATELEYPIDLLEPLAFLLNHMLEQLCARLEARALAANEIRLRLELEAGDADGRWLTVDGRVEEVDGLRSTADGNDSGSSETLKSDNSTIFERTLRLPVPMVDARVFLKLMQLDLQAHPPPVPVVKVWLRAEPAEPRRTQNGLFAPEAPEAERLELTLARIEKVVRSVDGRSSTEERRVGSPEIVDTHRADAWRIKRFGAEGLTVDSQRLTASSATRVEDPCHTNAEHTDVGLTGAALRPGPTAKSRNSELETRNWPSTIDHRPSTISALRVFRPAVVAVVEMKDGQPVKVASPERPTIRGEVVWCAGPWRSSGEWWSERAWSRQEWDVAVRNEEGVTVYRIFRDEIAGRWFVEGSYD
jgi:protein ImuB